MADVRSSRASRAL